MAHAAMETVVERMKRMKPVGHLMVALAVFNTGHFMISAFEVDIMVNAICPGQTACSQVIYLTTARQLCSGVGVILLAPTLGNLSDNYGRRPVLMTVFLAAIAPPVLLLLSRSEVLVLLWVLFSTIASILINGGLAPTTLAYVADLMDESQLASAVGFTLACVSLGHPLGTVLSLLARSDIQAFWISAVLQVLAAVYLKTFVKETNTTVLIVDQPQSENTRKLLPKPTRRIQRLNIKETFRNVWASRQLRSVALVDFMYSFGLTGVVTFLMFYLKVAFNYGKDEFAKLMLISGVSVIFGQMVLYPLVEHLFGDHGALLIALAFCAGQYFVFGFAWAWWVPYLGSAMALFISGIGPAVATIVCREVENQQQGKVQGFMSGVKSLAGLTAPLVLAPLTAVCSGDDPPFHLRGLPFIMCGVLMVVVWVTVLWQLSLTRKHSSKLKDLSAEGTVQFSAPQDPQHHVHHDIRDKDGAHVGMS